LDAGFSWSASLIWDREYGVPNTQNTTDGHIYADSSGVLICGQFDGPFGTNIYDEGDAYLIKFDPQGDTSWVQTYTGNGSGVDNAFNLKSDGEHIYVTGPTATYVHPWGILFGLETQIFVQKYTMGGTLLWTQLYGGSDREYSRGLEIDDEFIYLSATTQSYVDTAVASDANNTLLLKLRKDSGGLVSQHIWGGMGIDEASMSIDQDDYGFIYLSGFTTTADDGTDAGTKRAVIIKVRKDDLVSVDEIDNDQKPLALTVYPNPFSFETTFRTDHYLRRATLSVYNVYGQVVKQLDNLSGETITFSRDNLPAGLFFLELSEKNRIIAYGKIIIQ
jgi:hypothetical protein